MSDGQWENICVVGLGGHARTKLLPAILRNGQSLAGVVTSKNAESDSLASRVAYFQSVEDAISGLPGDTLFIIATSPVSHFGLVMPLLISGRDVLVEKPAFVTADEARLATEAARMSGAVLVEGFMNRHTATHSRFLEDLQAHAPRELDFVFTIPEAPTGTFRSEPAIGSSNLFDMGCYLLATLSDAHLPLDQLRIESVDNAGRPDRELLHLAGEMDGIVVTAKIGVDENYVNRLQLRTPTSLFSYAPFIFGRPGPRVLEVVEDGQLRSEQIEDLNAFEEMLKVPRSKWRQDQEFRFVQIIDIAKHLERLGIALARLRRTN